MKKILWTLIATLLTSASIAQTPAVNPPISNLYYGTWRIAIISTQMQPAKFLTVEYRQNYDSVYWGDKGCFITSRVKDAEGDTFNASCIKLTEPYKMVDTVLTFEIPDSNDKDMHFTAKGIENIDVWTHFISGPIGKGYR